MNTATHLLVSGAVLTRRGETAQNIAAVAGALIPDLYIYGVWIWSKLVGIAERAMWRDVYWTDPVQLMSALSNSVPLYAVLLAIGLLVRRPWLRVFVVSALLHLALDFPFHHGDAHAHFWPFTGWRFLSPLSYWNATHHAQWVGLAELGLVALCAAVLWRRFTLRRIRAAVVVGVLAYFVPRLYFTLAI
ncbi:MAG: cobalamin biosynthesis protein CobQ [Pseudomonadota bacterium]